ncbi:hypothetical protein C1646_765505 [Rhizophagus diaphanus]|nr:hypothetical protein C1646_765505 [Rhizophagus diaphanus] [Rhizophagus sp. MUCL 43196]
MVIVEEFEDYPEDKIIIYKQKNEKRIVSQSFTYKIITLLATNAADLLQKLSLSSSK